MIEQKIDKTEAWLKWRMTGIGSSDAPIIMQVSEYKTPFELWEEKSGKIKKDQTTNYIQDKGNRAEPYARAIYELRNGMKEFPALQGQHVEHKFLLGSSDGFCAELGKGVEFKLASREDHERVRNEKTMPQKYYPQVQHLMYVFGARTWDYGSYYVEKGQPLEAGELLILPVKFDPDWFVNYLVQASYFWKCVQDDTPPELTDRDARLIKTKDAVATAQTYLKAVANLKLQEGVVEELKAKLLVAAKDLPRAMFGDTGVVVKKIWRKGNVVYAKVPELKGVDLNQYRGASTSYFQVDVPKK